ncbi:MAG: hypothetical protein ACP5RK_00275 [Candidatus Micrarchaeia archaeon]
MEYAEIQDPKIIEEVDSIGKSSNVVEIDMSSVISKGIVNVYSYDDALEKLSAFEGKEEIKKIEKPQAPAPVEEEKVEKAAEEIKEVIGSIGKEFEKNIKRETGRIKGEKLVLPTLSLQDQISELEKISEGIDENVFTEEQMKIVKEEVTGLKDKVKMEKTAPTDEFQKSLISLRNQKIEEVLGKIK